jgi:two-component system sensor histidine kinase/response regulator
MLEDSHSNVQESAAIEPTQQPKPVILIVEDNPIQQKLFLLLADKLGVTVHVVSSGSEALEAVTTANGSYQAILMDWRLPDLDGISCTRRIREHEAHEGKHIPIIGVSACAMNGDREAALAAGMDDYLTKPFTMEELQETLWLWIPSLVSS